MDEQRIAERLVVMAREPTAADPSANLLRVLRDADRSWREYQNYLTGADKPFRRMIRDLDKLTEAVERARSLSGDKAVRHNLEVARELTDTIHSFKDPGTFQ